MMIQEKFFDCDVEKAPLLQASSPRLMKYSDIPSTIETTDAVIPGDPLFNYLLESESNNHERFRDHSMRYFGMCIRVYSGVAWCVEDGRGFVAFEEHYKSRNGTEKILYGVSGIVSIIMQSLKSREKRKRGAELKKKMQNLLDTTLGKDKLKQMVELTTIAVHPKLQGKGYGTQLGKVVSAVADSKGRECFLFSSNVKANTVFYNNLRYEIIDTFTLGEDNPKWDKEPVTIALMVRKPSDGTGAFRH
ncbi:hypothetical protein ABKN59_005785 [Abortiporus biennis]